MVFANQKPPLCPAPEKSAVSHDPSAKNSITASKTGSPAKTLVDWLNSLPEVAPISSSPTRPTTTLASQTSSPSMPLQLASSPRAIEVSSRPKDGRFDTALSKRGSARASNHADAGIFSMEPSTPKPNLRDSTDRGANASSWSAAVLCRFRMPREAEWHFNRIYRPRKPSKLHPARATSNRCPRPSLGHPFTQLPLSASNHPLPLPPPNLDLPLPAWIRHNREQQKSRIDKPGSHFLSTQQPAPRSLQPSPPKPCHPAQSKDLYPCSGPAPRETTPPARIHPKRKRSSPQSSMKQ